MSLFRKPKKIQRRMFCADDEEDGEPEPPPPPVISHEKKEKPVKTKSLLSFVDEEEEEAVEVFKVKKSSQSKRLAKRREKERRRGPDGDNNKYDNNVNEDETNNSDSQPPKPKKKVTLEGLILSGREALAADGAGDMSDSPAEEEEDEEDSRGFHKYRADSVRAALAVAPGHIPDAALIHAARKTRQQARELGDFVPITKEPTKGSRLVRDEDIEDDDDEDGRIQVRGLELPSDKPKRGTAAAPSNEELDSEAEEWEEQQMQKAMPAIADIAGDGLAELNPFAVPTAPAQLQAPGHLRPLGAARAPATAQELVNALADRLKELQTTRDDTASKRDELRDRLVAAIRVRESRGARCAELDAAYRRAQAIRGYITDLIECLDEKMPELEALETRALALHRWRCEYLVERRRADVRDQANDVLALTARPGAAKAVETEEKRRRCAEREGRRRARRRRREHHAAATGAPPQHRYHTLLSPARPGAAKAVETEEKRRRCAEREGRRRARRRRREHHAAATGAPPQHRYHTLLSPARPGAAKAVETEEKRRRCAEREGRRRARRRRREHHAAATGAPPQHRYHTLLSPARPGAAKAVETEEKRRRCAEREGRRRARRRRREHHAAATGAPPQHRYHTLLSPARPGAAKAVETEEKRRRCAEREGRRRARRRRREHHAAATGAPPQHRDGDSSDDELPPAELSHYQRERDAIRAGSAQLFADALPAWRSVRGVCARLARFRRRSPALYGDAYVCACLPRLLAPYVRHQLILWNPLADEDNEDYEKMDWYKCLMMYGVRPEKLSSGSSGSEDESDPIPAVTEQSVRDDPDLGLVPAVVARVVLPKLTELVEQAWDPMCVRACVRLRQLLLRAAALPAARAPLARLAAAARARLRAAALADVFLPPQVTEGAGSAFWKRCLGAGVRLLRATLALTGPPKVLHADPLVLALIDTLSCAAGAAAGPLAAAAGAALAETLPRSGELRAHALRRLARLANVALSRLETDNPLHLKSIEQARSVIAESRAMEAQS